MRHFVAVLLQSVAVLLQLLRHPNFLIYRDLLLFVAVVAVFLENSENQFFKKIGEKSSKCIFMQFSIHKKGIEFSFNPQKRHWILYPKKVY